ncbi:TetR/AcrR family transcriptional regulator [Sutterella sp.]|uniref:TetR/AcrR family transcriptional regulator n=1 Tax=Sutterella sp. TaxID=1981025 RepID=UPI0025F9D54B|nr:TetR family transcriptional regulator [uncultured Sutterella sp.]
MTDDLPAEPSDSTGMVFTYNVPAPAHARRRRDPERRSRIIDATIEVIEEVGVAGTTMRRVAKQAGVPLGSMTYHFTDREELLRAAFARFDALMTRTVLAQLQAAQSPEEMLDVVARIICGPADRRALLLSLELYAYASRREDMKPFAENVLRRSRREFMRFFPPATAAAIEALFDGAYIHRAYDLTPPSFEEVRMILGRLAGR